MSTTMETRTPRPTLTTPRPSCETSPTNRPFAYGVSGGGIIGLDMVTRYPELVRVFVSQEPPLLELLPDADQWRARIDAITRGI